MAYVDDVLPEVDEPTNFAAAMDAHRRNGVPTSAWVSLVNVGLSITHIVSEAITVGLALLRRTGDASLIAAAERVAAKIAAAQPQPSRQSPQDRLRASPWHALPDSSIDAALLRRAIRDCRVLSLEYRDPGGQETRRDVLPIVLLYFVDGTVLAAWCTLRQAFRHFRIDRITACTPTTTSFAPDAARLRRRLGR